MSELSGNEKILEVGEARVYKRLLVPRKENVKINEVAVNDAGSLVTTSSTGAQQVIGPAVVPPTPGLAAVAAADASAIGRSISVTGTVSATAVTASGPIGSTTNVLTPLITSATDLALQPVSKKVVLAGDSILVGAAPSTPITVTAATPNTTATLGSPSTPMCGFFTISTSALVNAEVTVTVPCTTLHPAIFLQARSTTGGFVASIDGLQVAEVTVDGTTLTFNAAFLANAPIAGVSVFWFVAGRA